jgi:nitric oxide reductase subunit B
MAVGFWNFLGAGVFGFLINLPVVSYFEVGTLLTPNHGHAAMMGVFGMLGVSLMVFAFREASSEDEWRHIGKLVGVSFFGLNAGLLLMVATNLFPGGVYQLYDVLANGYWHARSPEFLTKGLMHTIEWLRLPADVIFIGLGCAPLVLAGLWVYAKKWFPVQAES